MSITLLRSGYLARGRGGKRLGVFEHEWQAQAHIDAERVSLMPPGQVRVGEWLSGWRVLFPGEASVDTLQHQRYMVQPFVRAHGDELVSAFTALRAQAWAVEHPSQVKFLRAAWRKAVLMDVASLNVWRLVELPRRKKPPVRPPTPGELERIIERCGELALSDHTWWYEFGDLVRVAAFTGARQGGLRALRARDVEWRGNAPFRMTVTEKGEKTRTVAVLGDARRALQRQFGRHRPSGPSPALQRPLFLSMTGCDLTSEAIGSSWRKVRGDFPGSFHSLKHFAATWMRAQGAVDTDVAIQLGHTDSAGRPYTALLQTVYEHPDHEAALQRIEAAVGS